MILTNRRKSAMKIANGGEAFSHSRGVHMKTIGIIVVRFGVVFVNTESIAAIVSNYQRNALMQPA